jgi:hypothetical protein
VRDAERLAAAVGNDCEAVLLGSVATAKYAGILCEILGSRLRFPAAFVSVSAVKSLVFRARTPHALTLARASSSSPFERRDRALKRVAR